MTSERPEATVRRLLNELGTMHGALAKPVPVLHKPNTWKHQKINCPVCGSPNDHATDFLGTADDVTSGSISVCFECGEISVFEVGPFGVALREATLEEVAGATRQEPKLFQALNIVRAKRASKRD